MNTIENDPLQNLLEDMPDSLAEQELLPQEQAKRRNLSELMRKIPVTMTLEVGSARMSLHDLINIEPNSVVELDRAASEPLVIKVNGTPIGRAVVVVSGDNYALKVLDLGELNLDLLAK